MDKLDAVVFDAPSGGIQAILTAQLSRGGKLKRVGHAYIFVDKAPSVSVSALNSMTFEELGDLIRSCSASSASCLAWLPPTARWAVLMAYLRAQRCARRQNRWFDITWITRTYILAT